MRLLATSLCVFFVVTAACGCSKSGKDALDGGNSDGPQLVVEPASASLTTPRGDAVEQAFAVRVHYPGGDTVNVTDQAQLTHDNAFLGHLDEEVFIASGTVGGRVRIRAEYDSLSASAELIVNVEEIRIDDTAPPNAPDLFDEATEDASLAPVVVYPPDGTLVPMNLGDFEVHWTDSTSNDLWEVAITSELVTLRIFATGSQGSIGRWLALAREEWALTGESNRGAEFQVRVRGLAQSQPARVGSSSPVTVAVSSHSVNGGLYYWTTQTSDASPAGIYRHDWSRPGQTAEQFYTTAESDSGRCVGCHALSRDGTQMGLTFDGGPGTGSILDVGSRALMLPVDGSYRWSFSAWSYDGRYLATELDGHISLRDGQSGADLGTVPTGAGYATYPDFSPVGGALVYGKRDPAQVVVHPFDDTTATWATPIVLGTGSVHDSYPAWSPDGEWILYNQPGPGGNELWAIKADNSMAPVALGFAEAGGNLHNSWPRWAPFAQTLGEGEVAETVLWFTFSSNRDFGVRMVGQSQPQVWMSPFFPERATRGEDPSTAAFRLPFQNLTGNNHIAQWTEAVVPID